MIQGGPRVVAEPCGGVRLREVTPEDAERLHRWRVEPSARTMFRDDRDIPWEDHLAFLGGYFQRDCDDRWFVIEVASEPIGSIALYGFSPDGQEAEWGRFVVTPGRRGRGFGRRALVLLLAHARELGLRRLRCEVAAENPRAEALYRSLGFVREPREDESVGRFVRLVAPLVSAG